jgi:hypothetical protein
MHRFMIFLLIFVLVIVQINLFFYWFSTPIDYWLHWILCIIFGTWGWIVLLELFLFVTYDWVSVLEIVYNFVVVLEILCINFGFCKISAEFDKMGWSFVRVVSVSESSRVKKDDPRCLIFDNFLLNFFMCFYYMVFGLCLDLCLDGFYFIF